MTDRRVEKIGQSAFQSLSDFTHHERETHYPDFNATRPPVAFETINFPGEIEQNPYTGCITLIFRDGFRSYYNTEWRWLNKAENILQKNALGRIHTLSVDSGVVLITYDDDYPVYNRGPEPEFKYFTKDGQLKYIPETILQTLI